EAALRPATNVGHAYRLLIGGARHLLDTTLGAEPIELPLEELNLARRRVGCRQAVKEQLRGGESPEAELVPEHRSAEWKRGGKEAVAARVALITRRTSFLGQGFQRCDALLRGRVSREENGCLGILRRRPLREERLPDLRRLMRVIARGDHQLEAHVVGLAFVVAREGEDARYGRQLDQWTDESDSGCTGEGGEEDRCCRLGAKIAELLHGVPSHVMADLMAKNVRDLRLVLGVQEEACPDLHHSVGGHGGIHVWRLDDVNANTVAMRRGEATDERQHVAVD